MKAQTSLVMLAMLPLVMTADKVTAEDGSGLDDALLDVGKVCTGDETCSTGACRMCSDVVDTGIADVVGSPMSCRTLAATTRCTTPSPWSIVSPEMVRAKCPMMCNTGATCCMPMTNSGGTLPDTEACTTHTSCTSGHCGECVDNELDNSFTEKETGRSLTCKEVAEKGGCSHPTHGEFVRSKCKASCNPPGGTCCVGVKQGVLAANEVCTADASCTSSLCGACSDFESAPLTDTKTGEAISCEEVASRNLCGHSQFGLVVSAACPNACSSGLKCCIGDTDARVDVIDPLPTSGDKVCTVTTYKDDDALAPLPWAISLRACLAQLNNGALAPATGAPAGSRARIHFNIVDYSTPTTSDDGSGSGDVTITLSSTLKIKTTVTLDGSTQPRLSVIEPVPWTPSLVLVPSDAVTRGMEVHFDAVDAVVKGVRMSGFTEISMALFGIRPRIVGVHISSTSGVGGVNVVTTASGAVIGDPTAGEHGRVVVQGGVNRGIEVAAPSARIANVYVGVGPDGKGTNGPDTYGIYVTPPAPGAIIGDANAGLDGRVIVGGCGESGIRIEARDASVVNAYIGVAADGVSPAANAIGISIYGAGGGTTVGVGSHRLDDLKEHLAVVVGGNDLGGIFCSASSHFGQVYIGVGADGRTPVPNKGNGFDYMGISLQRNGLMIGPGAIISGNYGSGVAIKTAGVGKYAMTIRKSLIGLVDPLFDVGAPQNSFTTDIEVRNRLVSLGNHNYGLEILMNFVSQSAFLIETTAIGGNFKDGIYPATSSTALQLGSSSVNYPKSVPLVGNGRADQLCERCACTAADSTSSNNKISQISQPWSVDCTQMALDTENRFGGQITPAGFLTGGNAIYANTSGPLTIIQMAISGLHRLPWLSELTADTTAELTVLDLSDNPNLDPVPQSSIAVDNIALNQTIFSANAFPHLSSLFLQGTDLSSFANETLAELASTLESLDLSRPSKPPASDVELNFTGFHRLAAMLWYDNSKCPRGYFATAAINNRFDSAICARCTVGTYQPDFGQIGIDSCQSCPTGTVDRDNDPSTPCTVPPFRLAAEWGSSSLVLTEEDGYLQQFVEGETYEFEAPPLTKDELFIGFAGPVDKIVYGMRFRAHHQNSSSTSDSGNNTTSKDSKVPGKFFVDDSGDVLATVSRIGIYTGELFARDSVGAEIPVHTWDFEVVAAADESIAEATGNGGSIAAGVLGGLLVFGVGMVVFLKHRAYQDQMRAHDFEAELILLRTGRGEGVADVNTSATSTITRVPREVKRHCVTRTEKIGEGAFGEVFKGILDESGEVGGVPGYLVACKSVLDPSSDGAKDLLQEAVVMAQVGGHPNLVSLIGVVTSGIPLLLVVSYCELGSLLAVIRNRAELNDPLSTVLNLRFCVQIATGMQHLANLFFIHRDLAARNVLVDSQFCAKVADFGLSRVTSVDSGGGTTEEDGNHYYRSQTGIFPVRWTAPEAMTELKFTVASDVWSFGVVMAEIFQDGRIPYAGVESTEAVIRMVREGERIARPQKCPRDVYTIMRACWSENAACRPTFEDLIAGLETEFDAEQSRSGGAGCGTSAAAVPRTPSAAGYSEYSSGGPAPEPIMHTPSVEAYSGYSSGLPVGLPAPPTAGAVTSSAAGYLGHAGAGPVGSNGGGYANISDNVPGAGAGADAGAGASSPQQKGSGGSRSARVPDGPQGFLDGDGSPPAPPQAAAGDEFRSRAPSVYLGFGADAQGGGENDETRL